MCTYVMSATEAHCFVTDGSTPCRLAIRKRCLFRSSFNNVHIFTPIAHSSSRFFNFYFTAWDLVFDI